MTTAVSALEPFVSIGNTRTVSEVTHAFSMRARVQNVASDPKIAAAIICKTN